MVALAAELRGSDRGREGRAPVARDRPLAHHELHRLHLAEADARHPGRRARPAALRRRGAARRCTALLRRAVAHLHAEARHARRQSRAGGEHGHRRLAHVRHRARVLEGRQPEIQILHGDLERAVRGARVGRVLAEQLELRHVAGREVPAVRMELEGLDAARIGPVDRPRHERLARAARRDVPEARVELRVRAAHR